MRCPHFDAAECRSCTLMGVPYERQVTDLGAEVRGVFAGTVAELGLVHFDVARRTGELKHLIVTASPNGDPAGAQGRPRGRGGDRPHR